MPIGNLMQTNGTIDTFYKYKKRVIPGKQICQLPNAMCTYDQLCKPGYQVIKKLDGMYCCPVRMPLFAGPGTFQQLCKKLTLAPAYDIPPNPHPQTHDRKTFHREHKRQRRTPRPMANGAQHQNQVVAPDSGTGIGQYLVIGGIGFVGYKMFKKWKAKRAGART